jgi:hypothetical protein
VVDPLALLLILVICAIDGIPFGADGKILALSIALSWMYL